MLLEALDAEKLLANRLATVPRRGRGRAPEDATNERCQLDLSALRWRLSAVLSVETGNAGGRAYHKSK